MRILFYLLLFIGFSQTAAAQRKSAARVTPADKRLVGLDTALNNVLKQYKAAGFAVAIVEKDKIVYSKGFGYRDFEKKLPVTSNTLFPIGSSTKAFTTALLGILEKDGKLKFSDLAIDHLPELRFFNDEMTTNITVRDLATHRTGLPRHDYSWYLFKTDSRKELMGRLKYQEPSAKMRTRFQYNNFMFLLQGMIAEKITGKTWEETLKEKIFTPLNMTRTVTSIEEMEKDGDISFGYGLKNDSIIKKLDYYKINSMGPAGSINSSVDEVANWLRLWIHGGKFNGKEVIPASYINDAISSHMVAGNILPGKESNQIFFQNYGLGWFLSSYRGKYRVEHGGNIDGFSANVAYFPGDSIGIVVLVNQDGSSVPSVVRNMVADRMLNLPYFNWNSELSKNAGNQKETIANLKKAAEDSRAKNTKPSHPLKDYAGIYHHGGYGEFEIELRNDSLFAKFQDRGAYLKHYHYDVFDFRSIDKTDGIDTSGLNNMLVRFNTAITGQIESINFPIEGALEPIKFMRKDKEQAVDSSKLTVYLGEYEISGMTIKVYNKADVLYVFVPGQPDYETVYNGDNKFSLKEIKGYSVEFLMENGKATALKFIQPNGVFTATKK